MAALRLVCRFAAPLLAPWVLAALAFASTGCRASYVDRGAALYAERNYVEAEQVFEHNEARLSKASNAERARYGLYRAATFLALGDAARAHGWLVSTSNIAHSDADALSFEERRTLSAAWRAHARITARNAPTAPTGGAPLVTASVGLR